MALKEQANKKKSPRNKNDRFRDGKPLEVNILKYDNKSFEPEDILAKDDDTIVDENIGPNS